MEISLAFTLKSLMLPHIKVIAPTEVPLVFGFLQYHATHRAINVAGVATRQWVVTFNPAPPLKEAADKIAVKH
eukprot:1134459-Pelagomonas_calceolata.AAC.2